MTRKASQDMRCDAQQLAILLKVVRTVSEIQEFFKWQISKTAQEYIDSTRRASVKVAETLQGTSEDSNTARSMPYNKGEATYSMTNTY